MTTATRRRALAAAGLLLGSLLVPRSGRAVVLDDRGEIRLGARAYTAVRIGTQVMGGGGNPLSYPGSGAGHVRQNRYFLELKFDQDIHRLATETKGLAWLFGGFLEPSRLRYTLQYRGEGEGIYDFGPDEFQHQFRKTSEVVVDQPNVPALGLSPRIPPELAQRRFSRLRRIARQRNRFFIGYLDFAKGPVFVRAGRQVLAWGETDVFRLLDNINPLDDSFGGFFIALDERRLPLDMVRSSYGFGSLGPIHDAFLEGYVATGRGVSTYPGVPAGSPWEPGGLGHPNPALRQTWDLPDTWDVRGGARLVFNLSDATFTLAHYYTYFDVPGVRFRLPGAVQLPGEGAAINTARFGNEIQGIQTFPRVPITGASVTFPVPSLYTVVRSELAYFQGEPMNRQGRGNSANSGFAPGTPEYEQLVRQNNTEGGLDPFVYPGFLDLARQKPVYGEVLQRDTINFSLGLDVNRFVRLINPQQTLFISTQFFFKHVFDSPGDLVLPVPYRNIPVASTLPIIGNSCGTATPGTGRPCQLRPRLYHLADNRLLHTLLISTSYSGGRIIPSIGMFYDWQGTFVGQPGITFVRDPFRFIVDYTVVAGPPSGQFGTVRDRDNVRFQAEFVF